MSKKGSDNQPSMIEMQNAIKKVGGLFYQYRPCRRDAATIYDIENIRHGVIYAQTPLHMNDPFDSMIGFSAQKIYNNALSIIIDAFNLDEYTKAVVQLLLEHKAFGTMGKLIKSIIDLKHYIKGQQSKMHQTHIPFDRFVMTNATSLYSKLPQRFKNVFVYQSFVLVAKSIGQISDVNLTEEELLSFFKLDNVLSDLQSQIEKIQSETYVPLFQQFLSKLTISCFSASGWDNQLMWSHYANSYSGICVEYDFSKIKDFIGFIYPVTYTDSRPTVSLQDLGVSRININNGEIVKCDTNINSIFSYLLAKNKCWQYEDEWRIINIGEEDTPIFIDMPFIKSITFGINIDTNCKRLLLDVCAEKSIECYELIVSKESFSLSREPIDLSNLSFDPDEEANYIELLTVHITTASEKFDSISKAFVEAVEHKEFNVVQLKNTLTLMIDLLCDCYYIKGALNQFCEKCGEDLSDDDIPTNIVKTIQGIDMFVSQIDQCINDLKSSIPSLTVSGQITPKESLKIIKQITDADELNDKLRQLSWNQILVNACNNSIVD